jgi:hypothetical protein
MRERGPCDGRTRRGFLASLPAFAFFDVLGSYDRVDLYSALIVDAPNLACAECLLDAAFVDTKVTPGQRMDLNFVFGANYGKK